MTTSISPIAHIRTPFKEKFAVPRQPGLANAAIGEICFTHDFQKPDFIRGIEQFSHLWLIFGFHKTTRDTHSALVRPPRLGGNQKVGVFASRSTFRPNNLGLSVVELMKVTIDEGVSRLHVKGMDLVDQTPIYDIKPYLAYVDAVPEAASGYAQQAPSQLLSVSFSTQSIAALEVHKETHPNLQRLIEQVLSQDPRPAYRQAEQQERLYGVKLYEFDIRWRVAGDHCIVEQIDC